MACSSGHTPVAKVLIDAGAMVVCANREGFTALHGAAMSGNIDIVNMILKRAFDLEQTGELTMEASLYEWITLCGAAAGMTQHLSLFVSSECCIPLHSPL